MHSPSSSHTVFLAMTKFYLVSQKTATFCWDVSRNDEILTANAIWGYDMLMRILDRLISHFGSKQETASAFNIGMEALRLWGIRGVPLFRALDIERATGGAVSADDVLLEARAQGRTDKRRKPVPAIAA